MGAGLWVGMLPMSMKSRQTRLVFSAAALQLIGACRANLARQSGKSLGDDMQKLDEVMAILGHRVEPGSAGWQRMAAEPIIENTISLRPLLRMIQICVAR